MARRARKDEERSMDSLMDAMTNVVGILLLILVVLSLDLTKKIEEKIAELKPVSEQELVEMKASRTKTLDNLKALQSTFERATNDKIDPKEAQQLALNLKNFEKENEELAEKTNDLQALLDKSKELKPVKDDKQIRNTEAVTELNKLEQLLAAKPELEEVAAREITLPNPRAADDGAYIYYVACKNKKIYVIGEPYTLMTKMRDILDKNYLDLAYSGTELGNHTYTIPSQKKNDNGHNISIKVPFQARNRRAKEALGYMNSVSIKPWDANEKRTIFKWVMGNNEDQQEDKKEFSYLKMRFDQEKIKKFFEANAGKGDFTYVPKFQSDRVKLELQPNENGGIPVDKLSSSAFVEMVRQAKNSRRTIIYFYVAPDSFDAYLRARSYVDNQQVAAGWRLWEADRITDFEPNKRRELVPYNYNGARSGDYTKIAQFFGPKQTEAITKLIENFETDFAALKIPEKPNGETVEEYTNRLKNQRIQVIRSATNDVFELYRAPLSATATVRETDAGIALHPPHIMHIRTFVPRGMPTAINPPRKPAPAGGAPKEPTPKITLD